jgi:uncharacterized protein YbbC (DUF1343 family)
MHQGELCEGAHVEVTDRAAFDPMRLGLEIAAALRQLYPASFDAQKMTLLLASQSTVDQLNRGEQPAAIMASWKEKLASFMAMRAKYLLYP